MGCSLGKRNRFHERREAMWDQLKEEQREEAKRMMESVVEMGLALIEARDEGEVEYDGEVLDAEEMEQRIHEDALSVEVRSDWHSYGEGRDVDEYRILVAWGGPAGQVTGKLNQWGEPESAVFEYQAWFTPWVEVPSTCQEDEGLLAYACCFWFGEG